MHRPLHSNIEKNEPLEVYHRSPNFLGLFVTKPAVTPCSSRGQMNNTYLSMGYCTLWVTVGQVVWPPEPPKVKCFPKMFKNAEKWAKSASIKTGLFGHFFFKMLPFNDQ